MIRIERWSVCLAGGNPYLPPEIRGEALQGRVYGHHRLGDGDKIVTSRIVEVNGRIIRTESGSVYQLGWPDPAYLRWLRDNGYAYNGQSPISVGRGSAPRLS